MLRTQIASLIAEQLTLDEPMQKDLERGIYNAALQDAKKRGVRCHWENPDFSDVYKGIARRCIANLNPELYVGNVRLLERLREGEFPAHQIPFMSARELFPEHWQLLADEQLKRETTMLEGNQDEGSDMFKCKRCGKSRTRYWEMQTRSADEPMTIFIRCLNCGKEWRQ
jgi:DNA-directed RNA polymerase subunit M/transcription elongation factor TFIIS